ncbi:DUF2971 domain-containing protein, partial [Elstera litoralis]|uniref:DUF2971 domain-containing protein n=1 Tax=Elstera litoralis TaxID=552518 RepID=UPI001E545082
LSIDIDENEFLFDIYVTMISIRQARDCFGDKKLNKFLISFSKYHEDNHIDRWRTYANDATGFRLEFDFSAFKKSVLKCFNAPEWGTYINFFRVPLFANGSVQRVCDGDCSRDYKYIQSREREYAKERYLSAFGFSN